MPVHGHGSGVFPNVAMEEIQSDPAGFSTFSLNLLGRA